MPNKKECVTCALKTHKGCEIKNIEGLRKGGCGACIGLKERNQTK